MVRTRDDAAGRDRPKAVLHPSKPAMQADGPGNKRVMVYLPPGLLRAAKLCAVDREVSVSEVFSDAAREYLTRRGRTVPAADPVRIAPLSPPETAISISIEREVIRQREAVEAILLRLDDLRAAKGTATKPEGTKAAVAMKAILRTLREAGHAGMSSEDLTRTMYAQGVRSGTADIAKAILRDAGVVRFETRRWYVDA